MEQKITDTILRTGGNKKGSLYRIVHIFMIGEEYRLKEEYGTSGKGLIIDGQKYSAWFNEQGITITGKDQISLSWHDAAKRIKQLLENGIYAPEEILNNTRKYVENEYATGLTYMLQDVNYDIKLFGLNKQQAFNENVKEMARHVKNDLPELINELNSLSERYKKDKTIMRFHLYNPAKEYEKAKVFLKPYKTFLAKEWEAEDYDVFITEKEIDEFLKRGGNMEGGSKRICEIFQRQSEEKAKKLKEEYGSGGGSPGFHGTDGSYANWDSKGIELRRVYGKNKTCKIILKWPAAAKRIQKMVDTGEYPGSDIKYKQMSVFDL